MSGSLLSNRASNVYQFLSSKYKDVTKMEFPETGSCKLINMYIVYLLFFLSEILLTQSYLHT